MAEGVEEDRREIPLGDEYDVVVVGAGIGGLASGALLAKLGYNVAVIERQERAGGYVTSYTRRGFEFQVPHLVGGCGPDGDLTRVMEFLGINLDFVKVEPFQRYIYPDHDIMVSSDVNEYADLLKDNFQPQTANINRFFSEVDSVARALDISLARRPRSIGRLATMATYPVRFPRALMYMMGGATLSKLLDKHFTDEAIKTVIGSAWPYLGSPPWELSALAWIAMTASYWQGAYMPVGGYGALTEAFTTALVSNGGTLMLGHEVTSINAEESRVSGVETVPRAMLVTPVVVSDADSKRTVMRLADRENFTRAYLDRTDELPLSMSGFVIHLGLGHEVDESMRCGSIFVQPSYDEREMLAELQSMDQFPDPAKLRFGLMMHSLYDPTLAPQGCTSLDVLVPMVPYNFKKRWGVAEGGVRGDQYKQTKEKYAEAVVEAVGLHFPDLISQVQAYDISTPITYERYTMALDGCWYDSAATPRAMAQRRRGPRTPLRGLYFTGSKSPLGGGIYPSIMGGVLAADSISKGKLGSLF